MSTADAIPASKPKRMTRTNVLQFSYAVAPSSP